MEWYWWILVGLFFVSTWTIAGRVFSVIWNQTFRPPNEVKQYWAGYLYLFAFIFYPLFALLTATMGTIFSVIVSIAVFVAGFFRGGMPEARASIREFKDLIVE